MRLFDSNVADYEIIVSPHKLKEELAISQSIKDEVTKSRKIVENILTRKDPRFLVVVGPCSIHDVSLAKDYAKKLKNLSNELEQTLVIVMRVYFEKPRTTVGWKGLINDPKLNGSFDIEKGLRMARSLLINLVKIGMPLATEALDPISPQYLQDLISWTAIGARTTESQTHREMSSGLSSPVGFKNGTDGSLDVAINAMKSVIKPHSFLGINPEGRVAIIKTKGNSYGHVVLRGGGGKPNYDSVNVAICEQQLMKANLSKNIIIDCSHENSGKDYTVQPLVLDDITHQIINGNQSICGIMIESNLEAGTQKIPKNLSDLKYGVSITDSCIDWKTTERCLRQLASKIDRSLTDRFNAKVDSLR